MFPYLFLTALLSIMSLKCTGFLTCDSDTDCQDGSSCIENICKICVKCSLIFRKGKTCENDFNDCGDCLEGYKEISVTDNSAVKKPCRPMKKRGKLKECANDNCPPDHYCSEKSCVKCFDCSLVNRFELEKCARDPNECGPCFAGYLLVHDTTRTNYKECKKFSHDPVPYNIASGSVVIAVLVFIAVGMAFAAVLIHTHRGFTSSNTIYHLPHASAPPLDLMEESEHVKCCNEEESLPVAPVKCSNEEESLPVAYERQEVQQARVFKWPSASYYIKNEEISEVDSEPNENRHGPAPPTSAEREETVSSHRIVICGECARTLTGRPSELNSTISGTHSQDEQPVETNVFNSDSAENNSHLVTEDPSHVPEGPTNESVGDLPLGQGQV